MKAHIHFLFAIMLAGALSAQAQEKKEEKKNEKPTGPMIACDQRVNKAAMMKVLSKLSTKKFASGISVKSALYYPAQVDDEDFAVGVTINGEENDVSVTMDEACKKVLNVKLDK